MTITFQNVKKCYGTGDQKITALNLETLTVESGKIIGLFGENGAGKSTFLKVLSGRVMPTEGTLVFSEPRTKGSIFYMVEEDFKSLNYSVRQVLEIVRGYYPQYDIAVEKKWLTHFAVPVKKKFQKLSKGQKGLVCTIAALASGAAVTILDETFVSLDVSSRKQLFQNILELYMASGRTFILTSHYATELSQLIESVWVMHKGALVLDQSVTHLKTTALELMGDKKALDDLTHNKKVLNYKEVGHQKKVYLLDTLKDKDRLDMKSNEIQVYPMDLDTLVMVLKEANNEDVEARD